MKQSRTALQTFFRTLFCIIMLQSSVASPLDGATGAVIHGVLDPYKNTSTPTKWLVALAAAATTQRWYANQSAYSSSCHEIGRIRYELSQLAESKVQRALLSDAQIDDRREQLEKELATAEKQKLGAGRRRVLWGVPAAVLVYITCRNLYGWRAEIARIRKKAEDAKKAGEKAEKQKERRKRAEEQAKIDSKRKGNTDSPEGDDVSLAEQPSHAGSTASSSTVQPRNIAVIRKTTCPHMSNGRCEQCMFF